MSPSLLDERSGVTLTLLTEIVAAQLGIPTLNAGSTTLKRQDLARGFEPDGSFYIQHEGELRGRAEIDLVVDPPDLILAMEVSRSAIDKFALFAAMGIPEV